MKKLYYSLLAAIGLSLSASASNTYVKWDMGTAEGKSYNVTANGFSIVDSDNDGMTWSSTSSTLSVSKEDGVAVDRHTVYCIKGASQSYPSKYSSDDWLFTPDIDFEAGKTYNVTFKLIKMLYAATGYEIKLGTGKSAEAMTTTLSAATLPEAPMGSLYTISAVITVPTAGAYYIGIHDNDANGYFAINEINIEQGVGQSTPAAVSGLTVTPDASGLKSAVISFTAPTQAKDGTALQAITKIEVKRNDEIITTLTDVSAGAECTYTDSPAVSGLYTYTVVAYNEAGAGDVASAKMFVGINTPGDATNVNVTNVSDSSALITWGAPAADKDGYAISANLVTYDLQRRPKYSGEYETIAGDINATEYTDALSEAGDQTFYIYKVIAKTTAGEASGAESNVVSLGTPYPMPFTLSFPRGLEEHSYSSESLVKNTYWQRSDDYTSDITSADGDHGFIYLAGALGGTARLNIGNIDLSSDPAPVLSYYTHNVVDSQTEAITLTVTITATDGTLTKTIEPYAPDNGWHKTLINLYDFAGKSVNITFTAERKNLEYLHLDAITVSTIYARDLKMAAFTAPDKVKCGEEYTLTADIVNAGATDVAADYTVTLYRDGTASQTLPGVVLAVGETCSYVFTDTRSVTDDDAVTYHAVIDYADDDNSDNNASADITAEVLKPSYPTIETLTGSYADGVVTLSWQEPDTSKARPYDVTETFESYESWATTGIGDWTFIDRDKALIAGFADVEMPGIPSFSQQSWWIFDNNNADFGNGSFATTSGHKFIASMVSGHNSSGTTEAGYDQNDDWAVSPELYGGAQTITVNARSYSMTDLETFDVLYSTGSTEPDDFITVATIAEVPYEWQSFAFDLPDGARRFAIRNISYGKLMLMVDDITYTPAGEAGAFTINGYNVYRDGVKINDSAVEECEYTDLDGNDGNHTYRVSVLYSIGESQPGNAYNPTSGITPALSAAETTAVRGAKGYITISTSNADAHVEIYTAAGCKIYSGKAGKVTAPAGIYIVSCGSTIAKVCVR
ncbi:MAG: choice-of-anchor J domain-containing protein [Muribaculaceae bacterium]